MKSPFPGIDPYLEQHWGDVHTRLMVYISDQVADQLPGDLQARVEESVCVDLDETSRWIYPDVKVVESPEKTSGKTSGKNSGAGVALAEATIAEPTIIPLPNEKPTQRHIEIVDINSGNRVVTAIELLSPTNKKEDAGRNAYRRKQLEYIAAGVNLVEIDFIRTGSFIVAAPEDRIPWDMRTPYIICVRRVQRPEQAEIIPIAIDHTIPNFRIPLRPSDADVVLQLQPLLDDCYRRGRYASIDYTVPPRPPLDAKSAAWAEKLLLSSRS